jgi:beta-lactamase regulating signal transducer with metallopeptidase domain
MLREAFYWILNMSIIATVYGMLLYTLRYIKTCPRTVIYALWGVVLLRMLCPVSFSSKLSLVNILSRLSGKAMVKTVPVEDFSLSLSNTIQRAATYQPIAYKSSGWENFFNVASMVWLVFALAGILAILILYGLTMSELKKAVLIRDDLYEGPMVNSPTVIGIFRPRIILPLDMDDRNLAYILHHERIHVGRRDNLWRMIAILAACIHWFNPMSWVFLKIFLNDCEMACDEGAIKKLNSEDRKEYARILLNYADGDRTIFSSAFASNKVKLRVMQVLSYRRLAWFSVLCFILLTVSIAVLLLTNGMV